MLDQFFKDDNAGGPNEGWDKWSSKGVLESDYVLIIGTKEWFDCFEGNQLPGTGLGAACEADDIRHLIYKSAGVLKNIRVVVFDDVDAAHLPAKLYRYHRFHAEHDFADLVRWLRGTLIIDTPRSSIPHNLPSLQPFFGREEELKKIADALNPEKPARGMLIHGEAGMGKTSLAVRAAYDAPPDRFEKIVYVSLKSRELDDDGVRDLSGFLISGLAELLNELARELTHPEIAKASEDQRPRLLHEALRGTRTLLILDNLESLVKKDRDTILTFVNRLPVGCKAILTARGRIGSAADELILEELSESASLSTLAKLAERNPSLAKAKEDERLQFYLETRGKPLLLRWTAGQIGRGSCVTVSDAIAYLRSCPAANNPLEFIFGDLVEDFSEAELRVLCTLTCFTVPAKVEHITEIAACNDADVDQAIRRLVNHSLVLPSEELKTFTIVSLVADFLSRKKRELIEEVGDRLEKRAYALVVENGYKKYDRFPVLDAAWPTVAAALPRFLRGPNELQTVCDALTDFLDFTGRWDEWLALTRDAESNAISIKNFGLAGSRAYHVGWVHHLRRQAAEVLACADRAKVHWLAGQAGIREQAYAIRLLGLGQVLAKNYSDAIRSFKEAVELHRTLAGGSKYMAIALASLAGAERLSGDIDAAEINYREALKIDRIVGNQEGVAIVTGALAQLQLDREDWSGAEALAREALSLSEEFGRQELIAGYSSHLAIALMRQGKKAEALPNAHRAIDIFTLLGLSDELSLARKTLSECES